MEDVGKLIDELKSLATEMRNTLVEIQGYADAKHEFIAQKENIEQSLLKGCEVANLLGVSSATITKMRKTKKIRARRVGDMEISSKRSGENQVEY